MRFVALIHDIRHAPDSTERAHALAPGDEGALDWALTIAGDDHEVIVLTAGPPTSDVVLEGALKVGADRALRVWVSSPDEEKTLDGNVRGISELLAATINDIGDVDLVLCGGRSADWGSGITGPAIAFALDIPHITHVSEIAHALRDDPQDTQVPADPSTTRSAASAIHVTQRRSDLLLHCELSLPALVTIAEGPQSSGKRERRQGSVIETLDTQDVGFEVDDPLPWPPLATQPITSQARHLDSPQALFDLIKGGRTR